MKKIIGILLLAATLTSCSTTSLSSAQTWLNDPKNQQMIQTIAQTAITLITAFGTEAKTQTTKATITGKLAKSYPDVPAGAVAAIAQDPYKYKHAGTPAR